MAKKRKKQKEVEEEKYEFVPPEFDEKQFLKDEMNATKRIAVTIGYGALFGVIAALLMILTRNGYLGLFLLIIGFWFMRYLFAAMKIDLSKFTRRTWLESGVWFFFTFLAVWILVINPPFVDYAAPEIRDIRLAVAVQGVGIINYNLTYNYTISAYQWQTGKHNMSVASALKFASINNTALSISARIADAGGISGTPTMTLTPNNPQAKSMAYLGNDRYALSIGRLDTSYLENGIIFTFSISAEDPSHNVAQFILPTANEIIVT